MSEEVGSGFASGRRLGLVLNGTLALLLACWWLWLAEQGLFWRADFSAFYTGWRMILDGQGARLFDLDLQAQYQSTILPERPEGEGLLPFVYPPHTAMILAPLALLSRSQAFAVWTLFQIGLCAVAAKMLLRLRGEERPFPWLMLVTVLAFPPLVMTFQQGQLSLLGLVCLLGFVIALKEDRPLLTACWIVVGTIKPQLMVMPCVLLLALRRWRALGYLLGLFGIWAVLTGMILGWECWIGFIRILRFSTQQFGTGGVEPMGMYNLKGLLAANLGREQAGIINGLVLGAWFVGIGVVLWLWRKPESRQGQDFDLRLALSLLIGVIVNPHLNPMDALVLVVPAVLFLGYLRRKPDSRPARWFAALVVCCPMLFLLDCYLVDPTIWHVRPFFLLMLGVAVWMVVTRSTIPASQLAG